jgi:polyphosphate kinase
MPRNLGRRVEMLFPVAAPCLRQTILHDILGWHLQDKAPARWLVSDGTYERLRLASGAQYVGMAAPTLEKPRRAG